MAASLTDTQRLTDHAGRPRVVVTGTGVISPVGNNTKDFWDALVQGRHGIGRIDKALYPGVRVNTAAEVKGFEPMDFMDRKKRGGPTGIVSSRSRRPKRRSRCPVSIFRRWIRLTPDRSSAPVSADSVRFRISLRNSWSEAVRIGSRRFLSR